MNSKNAFRPQDIQELPDAAPKLSPEEQICTDAKARLKKSYDDRQKSEARYANELPDIISYIVSYQQRCQKQLSGIPNSVNDFVLVLFLDHNINPCYIGETIFYNMPSRTNPQIMVHIFQKNDLTLIHQNCQPNSIFIQIPISDIELQKMFYYYHNKIVLQHKSFITSCTSNVLEPTKIAQALCLRLIEHGTSTYATNINSNQHRENLLIQFGLNDYRYPFSVLNLLKSPYVLGKNLSSIFWTLSQGNIRVIDQFLNCIAIAFMGYNFAKKINPKIKKHTIIICRDIQFFRALLVSILSCFSKVSQWAILLQVSQNIFSTNSISDFYKPKNFSLPISNDMHGITVNIDTQANFSEPELQKFKELLKEKGSYLNKNHQDDVFGNIIYDCQTYFIHISTDLETSKKTFPTAEFIHFPGNIAGKQLPEISDSDVLAIALIAIRGFIEQPDLSAKFPSIKSDDSAQSDMESFTSFLDKFFQNTQNAIPKSAIESILQGQDLSSLNTSKGHTERRKLSMRLGITKLKYTPRDDIILAFSKWSGLNNKQCEAIADHYFSTWKETRQYLFYLKCSNPHSCYETNLKESLVVYGLELQKQLLHDAIKNHEQAVSVGAIESRFADYWNFLDTQIEDWKPYFMSL